jgi:hypothetical protein
VEETLNKNILDAQASFEAAAQNLAAAVRREFPVGSRVRVTLGRAEVEGLVIRSGRDSQYQPDEVVIRNVVTGKERKFTAGRYCDAIRIDRGFSVLRLRPLREPGS